MTSCVGYMIVKCCCSKLIGGYFYVCLFIFPCNYVYGWLSIMYFYFLCSKKEFLFNSLFYFLLLTLFFFSFSLVIFHYFYTLMSVCMYYFLQKNGRYSSEALKPGIITCMLFFSPSPLMH